MELNKREYLKGMGEVIIKLIWAKKIDEFYVLWAWKVCLIFTNKAENNKWFDTWFADNGFMLCLGRIGIGVGHIFKDSNIMAYTGKDPNAELESVRMNKADALKLKEKYKRE
jgi:hypothetical protein